MRLRSTNPVYSKIERMDTHSTVDYAQATYKGIAAKTIYYILLVAIAAFGAIFMLANESSALVPLLSVSGIVGFISAMIAFVSPRATKVAGTIYCLMQGMVVGIVSLLFEAIVPGVVGLALMGTVAVVFVTATLFLTGIIKVTQRFMRFLLIFSLSVILTFVTVWIFSLFGATIIDFANPTLSLIVSLIMIFLATLYILFDLENIRQIVEGGQPKFLEWFASFGLAFTVVWLYMEILPLVARLLMASKD